jgi:hypothetical protein
MLFSSSFITSHNERFGLCRKALVDNDSPPGLFCIGRVMRSSFVFFSLGKASELRNRGRSRDKAGALFPGFDSAR